MPRRLSPQSIARLYKRLADAESEVAHWDQLMLEHRKALDTAHEAMDEAVRNFGEAIAEKYPALTVKVTEKTKTEKRVVPSTPFPSGYVPGRFRRGEPYSDRPEDNPEDE